MLIFEFLIIMINLHLCLSDRMDIRQKCRDYRPQRNVNMDEIKGQWHVAEVITHNETDFRTQRLMLDISEISIVATATDPRGSRHQHDDFRIELWDDLNKSNHIRGRISDINSGYWMALITEKDRELEGNDIVYNAVIQVLRKTDRYMVLHFCSNPLFTVSMVRDYNIPPPPEIAQEVHELLRSKGLEILSVKQNHFRRNSAHKITLTYYLLSIVIVTYRFFK